MDMNRFWRWTVVALAAFGVMLVLAGIFGTMQLASREEATVAVPEPQLTKTDGAKSSSQSETGWGESDEHSVNRSANAQSAGGQKSTDGPDKGLDNPGMAKQPDSSAALTNGSSLQHDQWATSLPNTAPADGRVEKQDVPQEKPNGSTNRTSVVKVTPKAETTSVAVSAHGNESKSMVAGGEKGTASAAPVQASGKNGPLHQDNQSDVGWNEDKGKAATASPGGNEEKELAE